MHKSKMLRYSHTVGVMAGMVLLVAGCTSSGSKGDESSPRTQQSTESGAASSGGFLGDARSLVDLASSELVTATGLAAVDVKSIKPITSYAGPTPKPPTGKAYKVAIIGCVPTGGCVKIPKYIADVVQKFGWTSTQSYGDGTPSKYQSLYETAISQGVNVIFGISIPPAFVSAQLAEAKSKGIITIAGNVSPVQGTGYTGYVDAREPVQKTVLSAWMVSESKGKANAVFASLQGNDGLGVSAGKAAFGQCTSCTSESFSDTIPNYINSLAVLQKAQSLAKSEAKANYLVWPTGTMPLQPVVQGISQAGRSGDLKLITSDLDPGSYPLLDSGGLAAATVISPRWIALAMTDAAIRGLAGESIPAADAWGIGTTLVDKKSAPTSGSYAAIDSFIQSKVDYLAPYQKAWGVDLSSIG